MREVVLVDYCDEHYADNEKREEATVVLTMGIDGEWKTIAACDEHGQRWLQVADLLRVHGIKTDPPRRKGGPGRPLGYRSSRKLDVGPVQCPLCPADRPPQSSRKVWRSHMRQQHGLTMPQFREQYPTMAAAVDALARGGSD